MRTRSNQLNSLNHTIKRLDKQADSIKARVDRYATWRFLVFVAGLLAVGTSLSFSAIITYAITGLWIILFATMVIIHQRLKRAYDALISWREIKTGHLARMTIDWAKLPTNDFMPEQDHPFAFDLNIVGKYSLMRLIDATVSDGGHQRLGAWLTHTQPDSDTIQQRQQLIAELIPRTRFRDGLMQTALLSDTRGKWNGARLMHWLNSNAEKRLPTLALISVIVLAVINIVLMTIDLLNIADGLWMVSFALYGLLTAFYLNRLGDVFSEVLFVKSELDHLKSVLQFIEKQSFSNTPHLQALMRVFTDGASKPSSHIRHLSQILAAFSLRANVIFWFLINLLIPWDLVFISLLDRNKGQLHDMLPRWLDVWYELEALNSLANFAYLNPEYTFPTIHSTVNSAAVSASKLGHPLIPHEERVCNDFEISGIGSTYLITGSNMSGKSSFLRTVGLNLQLAFCGSVTVADSMNTSLFRLYTSIQIMDSVVDGVSYFYAEVRRLRQLMNALSSENGAQLPLFFLIDEIFRGTNNRERLIGSRSYINMLVNGHGCGLISTHDLELTALSETLPKLTNYHFREDIEDQKMTFDYRLLTGPCPTTNALKIMEMEGLPVDF